MIVHRCCMINCNQIHEETNFQKHWQFHCNGIHRVISIKCFSVLLFHCFFSVLIELPVSCEGKLMWNGEWVIPRTKLISVYNHGTITVSSNWKEVKLAKTKTNKNRDVDCALNKKARAHSKKMLTLSMNLFFLICLFMFSFPCVVYFLWSDSKKIIFKIRVFIMHLRLTNSWSILIFLGNIFIVWIKGLN